jgi:hypothetical protein
MITWSIVRQRLAKHICAAADADTTVEEQSEVVFSVRSQQFSWSYEMGASW